jgi:YD repeat-containing protein
VIEQVTYAYDANGQRIVRGSSVGSLRDTIFSAIYDEANRMMAITLNPGTPGAKTYNLTYDDHGNLVQKQNAAAAAEVTLYTWDARNRLVGINASDAGGTATAAFKYDALGRRIERTVTQGANTQRGRLAAAIRPERSSAATRR